MEQPIYTFLADIDELKWFWTYGLRPLKEHEVYFLSTSARNKRLDDAEREYFAVGRSEMWRKEIVQEDDYARFIRGVRRCETNKLAYLTKKGMPYPDKVLVLYVTIVPIDAYSAMAQQIDNLIRTQRELADSVLKNSRAGIEQAFQNIRRSHTTGQSVFARSFGESEWFDIDSDIEGYDTADGRQAVQSVKDFLYSEIGKGNFIQVQTVGGFHWLIRKSTLAAVGRKYRTDPVGTIVASMTSLLSSGGIKVNEIVKNKNEMIPLPGTLQYGEHIVRVLNKDDFTAEKQLHAWPDYIEYAL